MVVKPLDDVMFYFSYAFLAYIVLFVIVCLNFYKALSMRKHLTPYHSKIKFIQLVDLFIDILCGLAMFGGLMFTGVLADNNALNWGYWSYLLSGISLASFIVFIFHVLVVFTKPKAVRL